MVKYTKIPAATPNMQLYLQKYRNVSVYEIQSDIQKCILMNNTTNLLGYNSL